MMPSGGTRYAPALSAAMFSTFVMAWMLRQPTIPASVPSGRATASRAEWSPSRPSFSQRRRRARGLRKPDDR